MTNPTCLAVLGVSLLLAVPAAQPARPEATSLLGKPLFPAPISAETRQTLEEHLKSAEIVYGRNPDNADATIWIGLSPSKSTCSSGSPLRSSVFHNSVAIR